MTKRSQNNQQGTGYPAGISFSIQVSPDVLCYLCYCFMSFCHGPSGIAWQKNCSSTKDETLLPIIAMSTLRGFNLLSFAVRIMVMITETLRLPRSVMFPKDIFLNKTAFLMPCSAGLFVGGIAGYLRKTKSSSLNVIRRLRILSLSWCTSSGLEHNFLNRLRMSFLAARYSSLLSVRYML